jgi:hypothetical protein
MIRKRFDYKNDVTVAKKFVKLTVFHIEKVTGIKLNFPGLFTDI